MEELRVGMYTNRCHKRNRTIDFLKGISALGVVLVHFQFPGVLGKALCSIGTAGVVFFFLLSGYFAFSEDDTVSCKNVIKRFRRNLNITLIAVAIYFIISAIRFAVMGDFLIWIKNFLNPIVYLRMIVLGDFEVILADPLWFMPALLYSYLILYCIHRFKLIKIAYILLPFLLILRIVMETYTNSFGVDWHLSGNFLVGALPTMLLGIL